MFRRVGRFAVHRPWLTILAWVVAAVALGVLAPGLKSTTDQAEFLPSHYESVQAGKVQEKAFPQDEQAAAVGVFKRSDGGKLTAQDKQDVAKVAAALQDKHYKKISKVTTGPEAVSPNGEIALANIYSGEKNWSDDTVMESIKSLRKDAKPLLKGTQLKLGVTGSAASNLDSKEQSGDTDGMIMMATLVLIIVLLLAIFRSPLIAILPVLIILLVTSVANGLIGTAADVGGLKADASVTPILIVVLFGVGTDYILFLLFRYRELLRKGEEPKTALAEAVARVGETIASAAGAVIASFLALLLSTMGMMKALGPSLAIAVGVTLIAALTLVPAVFSLLGTKAFWPSKAWKKTPKNRTANAVGGLVSRRPGIVAALSTVVLAVLAVGAFGFKSQWDMDSQLPDKLESVQAMKDLQKGFSAGQADPAMVFVKAKDGARLDKGELEAFRGKLAAVKGVDKVSPAVPSKDGSVVQFSVVTKAKPNHDEAIKLVGGELRDTAHQAAPKGSEALVGGTSAVLTDIENAVQHDYKVVFPVAGLAIMLILGLLLRSLVAPLYLMIAVALGFGATLGSTVWLFQDLKGEDGMLFMLPIIIYLFVVAIGTDYNILMVARLREEVRKGVAPREAIRTAVAQSAPTVASAAIILAGTFGVLLLAENSMLQQMGFAVAFGILLTAFVMAMLLVPTVTSLLGHKAWWPGHQDAPRQAEPTPYAGTDSYEDHASYSGRR
ncbi:MMPL family transporter [Streptomyces mobaraensis NBRC 13819 = DSM 40847]|uniref:MMPL family transporter n=2 Tax=Streptomyces mobaraensis TaxID=35621 RepID=A0A5N5W072_STRMB|nr:MMPL family transporter [Streptomyces mobaraensis]EMF00228.1 MMPL domain-containing protein [Streptomyces mobaraensis NBRC 13819 = DSM 40847]KAB7834027.1 MMPL family transporter [Streptomyces mobaraensis]QTT75150.1 MMPL family transporter [Streptomyces mobaraensis NBRC 13819 = DSM 40847]